MRLRILLVLFIFLIHKAEAQEITHSHSIYHAFIENKGQWNESVLFKSKFQGGNLWIEQHKFLFHLQDFSAMQEAHAFGNVKENAGQIKQDVVHLNFVGSNTIKNIEKSEPTTSYYNFFIGNDKSKWASDVRGYNEAVLKDLYTGIDLRLIEQKEQLKYEFVVAPGSDPKLISLEYAGQKDLSVDLNGDLRISTKLGAIIEQKPYAYQIINGSIREVKCEFSIYDNRISFQLSEYDREVELVIDPVLVFATYSGSPTDNFGMTATYASDGKAFSGGTIYGNAYPTPDPLAYNTTSNFSVPDNPNYGITDVFISKYSEDGTQMIWTTFIGGGSDTVGTETVHSLIADKNDNLYLYGATSSLDFPIQNGYQTNHGGGTAGSNFYFNGVYFSGNGTDIYVAKLSPNGHNLLGSTYMGGSANDGINYKITSGTYNSVAAYDSLTKNYGDQFRGEIMLDSVGNCLVGSCTRSSDFPTLTPFQAAKSGGQDGVIFKLTSDLSSLLWSSYYGGSNNDAIYSVKIDSSYNIVFAGGTSSNNLPGMGSGWLNSYSGGKTDGFVAKLNTSGTGLTNASYIGTSNYDQSFFVEIDRNDNVFLVGQSEGGLFPVVNSVFVNPGSSQFVIKLDPTLSLVQNSTVFGNGQSTINISPSAFLVDICGNIYISGWGANILQSTPLSGMPVTPDAFQETPPNGYDFYLLVIERGFTDKLYASYIGGYGAHEHVDGGTSRFDKNGVVYQSVCAGCVSYDAGSNSYHNWSDFPTTPNAWSSQNLSDNCNNLIFKFDFQLIPDAEFTADQTIGCADFEVTFNNTSTQSDSYLWDFGNGDTTSVIFNPIIIFDSVGVFDVYLYVTDSICLLTDTAKITITVADSITLSTSGDQWLCSPVPVTLTSNSFGTADYFIWSSNINFTDTLNTIITDSTLNITPPGTTTYYLNAGNAFCSKIDSVTINFVSSTLLLTANDSICFGESTWITASSTNPLISFDNFVWSPDSLIVNQTNSNNVEVIPLVTQYIYVIATSNSGCNVNDSIAIFVGNILNGVVVATASDYLIAEGDVVILYGQPMGYSYEWIPQEGVDYPNNQNTSVKVEKPTIFTFNVTDGICTKSDTVEIKTYTYDCDEPTYFVPNAFSPDGDNFNDVLYVRGPIQEMTFRIYDRWGELVFESFDRSIGWDGTFRGKQLDPDVYDYYLKVKCINDEEAVIKGNITLVR